MYTSEIKTTLSFLTLNTHILTHNFTFKVIRSSNSLVTSADIFIKQDYFLADSMQVYTGDTVIISLQNNDDSKITIFSGIVKNISTTSGEINLTAESRIVESETFHETFKDTNLKNVLVDLIDNLNFEASDSIQSQIVFRGTKEESINRLLKNKHYFKDLDNNFVIRDTPQKGTTYTVDDCLCSAKNYNISILPVPQIDINDIVIYQDKTYIIHHIVYDYQNKALMSLWIKPYSG